MPAVSDTRSVIPVLLVILDGVGCRHAAPDNPVSLARKPNWDRLWQEFAHTTIDASERSVGLPSGQMGNSEVGHLNIGAGPAQRARGGEALITADHGNVEMMHDPATGQAHTAHTLNLVPCLYVGRPAQMESGGALQDIAPTLLAMMGLPQPEEMTGRSLIQFTQ